MSSYSAEASTKDRDERRLFVPLSSGPYEWFCSGRKTWELRKLRRQFTPKHVRLGRRVELRRGYSSKRDALWGTIVEVVQAEGLDEFFSKVPFRQVIPEVHSLSEAKEVATRILSIKEPRSEALLGFKVSIDK